VAASNLKKKVLVLDADLHSGVLSTVVDRKPPKPLVDVLQAADSLDYSLWDTYIVEAHGVDFLLSDRIKKTPLPSWVNYHQLLRFAATRYDVIFVDLPEVINGATEEIVRFAERTFVVTTPELTSLSLAQQRLQELQMRAVPPDRLQVILNRWHRSDMKPQDVEKFLGRSVPFVVRNDYRAISRAIASGRPVASSSGLANSFAQMAETLFVEPKENPNKSRFAFF
jgi:pilus assembly protein CpaE